MLYTKGQNEFCITDLINMAKERAANNAGEGFVVILVRECELSKQSIRLLH